ncbi:sensor histidine kinase [Demequina capsici]|uniref:histidine kinase n=1 Tax=Demequina capsici TaxID=3075620 RepID=A0AA96J625_9MICO|nr:HAMP domain-containing sensor histidine kinase [Demequina sp. OYTSA14]WNM23757.1 HAMP domain-containing sensor histidine kinase [Demequina sp. OYTSA14]
MRSIRARLTVTLSALTAAVVLGAAIVGSIAVPPLLQQRFADQLESAATRASASLASAGGAELTDQTLPGIAGDSMGLVLLSSGEPVAANGVAAEDVSTLAALRVTAPTEVAGRYLGMSVDMTGLNLTYLDADGIQIPIDRVVLVMRTTDREEVIATIATWLLLGGVATSALLIAVAAIVVARGMRPLEAMADRAERIASGDRSLRLSPGSSGDPAIDRMASTVDAALDSQELAEQRLRTFLADASHELRTPLTTASGWVDLYLRGGLEDRERLDDAMTRVDTQLTRMRLMTDEMLALARTDAGRPLDRQPLDLADIARDVVSDARIAAPERSIVCTASDAALMRGDEARLAQVVRNLVGNAVQHTPADATITVLVEPGAEQHVLRVLDTGPGIAAADVPHLFERFWRGGAARSARGGAGLGLAIVQALVEQHDGTVAVASTPGQGTEFTVTLPIARG